MGASNQFLIEYDGNFSPLIRNAKKAEAALRAAQKTAGGQKPSRPDAGLQGIALDRGDIITSRKAFVKSAGEHIAANRAIQKSDGATAKNFLTTSGAISKAGREALKGLDFRGAAKQLGLPVAELQRDALRTAQSVMGQYQKAIRQAPAQHPADVAAALAQKRISGSPAVQKLANQTQPMMVGGPELESLRRQVAGVMSASGAGKSAVSPSAAYKATEGMTQAAMREVVSATNLEAKNAAVAAAKKGEVVALTQLEIQALNRAIAADAASFASRGGRVVLATGAGDADSKDFSRTYNQRAAKVNEALEKVGRSVTEPGAKLAALQHLGDFSSLSGPEFQAKIKDIHMGVEQAAQVAKKQAAAQAQAVPRVDQPSRYKSQLDPATRAGKVEALAKQADALKEAGARAAVMARMGDFSSLSGPEFQAKIDEVRDGLDQAAANAKRNASTTPQGRATGRPAEVPLSQAKFNTQFEKPVTNLLSTASKLGIGADVIGKEFDRMGRYTGDFGKEIERVNALISGKRVLHPHDDEGSPLVAAARQKQTQQRITDNKRAYQEINRGILEQNKPFAGISGAREKNAARRPGTAIPERIEKFLPKSRVDAANGAVGKLTAAATTLKGNLGSFGNALVGGAKVVGTSVGFGEGAAEKKRLARGGGGGLAGFLSQGLFSTLQYALPSLLLFGSATFVKNAFKEAEEYVKAMKLVEGQLKATSTSEKQASERSDKLSKSVRATAREYGVQADEQLKLTSRYVGAFQDQAIGGLFGDGLVDEQQKGAAQISRVLEVPPAELTDGVVAISRAYGILSSEIGDVALKLQENLGVEAKDTISILGDVASVANEAGIEFEDLAGITGVVLRNSGRPAAEIAEAFTRVLPFITQKKDELLEMSQSIEGLNDQEFRLAVTKGDNKAVLKQLGEAYKSATTDGRTQDSLKIGEIIGDERQAKAFFPLLADIDTAYTTGNDILKNSQGSIEARFQDIKNLMNQALAEMSEAVRGFTVSLHEGGVTETFVGAVQLLTGVVNVMTRFMEVLGPLPGILTKGAAALGVYALAMGVVSKVTLANSTGYLAEGLAAGPLAPRVGGLLTAIATRRNGVPAVQSLAGSAAESLVPFGPAAAIGTQGAKKAGAEVGKKAATEAAEDLGEGVAAGAAAQTTGSKVASKVVRKSGFQVATDTLAGRGGAGVVSQQLGAEGVAANAGFLAAAKAGTKQSIQNVWGKYVGDPWLKASQDGALAGAKLGLRTWAPAIGAGAVLYGLYKVHKTEAEANAKELSDIQEELSEASVSEIQARRKVLLKEDSESGNKVKSYLRPKKQSTLSKIGGGIVHSMSLQGWKEAIPGGTTDRDQGEKILEEFTLLELDANIKKEKIFEKLEALANASKFEDYAEQLETAIEENPDRNDRASKIKQYLLDRQDRLVELGLYDEDKNEFSIDTTSLSNLAQAATGDDATEEDKQLYGRLLGQIGSGIGPGDTLNIDPNTDFGKNIANINGDNDALMKDARDVAYSLEEAKGLYELGEISVSEYLKISARQIEIWAGLVEANPGNLDYAKDLAAGKLAEKKLRQEYLDKQLADSDRMTSLNFGEDNDQADFSRAAAIKKQIKNNPDLSEDPDQALKLGEELNSIAKAMAERRVEALETYEEKQAEAAKGYDIPEEYIDALVVSQASNPENEDFSAISDGLGQIDKDGATFINVIRKMSDAAAKAKIQEQIIELEAERALILSEHADEINTDDKSADHADPLQTLNDATRDRLAAIEGALGTLEAWLAGGPIGKTLEEGGLKIPKKGKVDVDKGNDQENKDKALEEAQALEREAIENRFERAKILARRNPVESARLDVQKAQALLALAKKTKDKSDDGSAATALVSAEAALDDAFRAIADAQRDAAFEIQKVAVRKNPMATAQVEANQARAAAQAAASDGDAAALAQANAAIASADAGIADAARAITEAQQDSALEIQKLAVRNNPVASAKMDAQQALVVAQRAANDGDQAAYAQAIAALRGAETAVYDAMLVESQQILEFSIGLAKLKVENDPIATARLDIQSAQAAVQQARQRGDDEGWRQATLALETAKKALTDGMITESIAVKNHSLELFRIAVSSDAVASARVEIATAMNAIDSANAAGDVQAWREAVEGLRSAEASLNSALLERAKGDYEAKLSLQRLVFRESPASLAKIDVFSAQAALQFAQQGKNPDEIRDAGVALYQARVALDDAIKSENEEILRSVLELQRSELSPEDEEGRAKIDVQLAQVELALARGTAARNSAQAALNDARNSLREIQKAGGGLYDAYMELYKAFFGENDLGVADLDVASADRQMEMAENQVERIQAQTAQIEAQRSRTNVLRDIQDANFELIQAMLGFTGDTVGVARVGVEQAKKTLANVEKDYRNKQADAGDVDRARAALANALGEQRDANLQDNLDKYSFLYDMEKISKGQYIQYLQNLRQMPQLTQQQLRDIDRQIKGLKGELAADLQFNLPSLLTLPTMYESRRLSQTAQTPGYAIGYQDNRDVQITLNIANGMSQQEATDMLSAALNDNRTGNRIGRY